MKINMLDTQESGLVADMVKRVVDGAAFVHEATAGIEAGSEMVWDRVEADIRALHHHNGEGARNFARALKPTNRLRKIIPLIVADRRSGQVRYVDHLDKGILFERRSAKEALHPR